MEQYNDDERVDDLKKWWKDNGASIIAGIVLGLIAIFGWQYWNS
ncbi:MAG: tetratricopeptide repeat protein, partial [Candidatus Competibacteraceae bacterium]